ncbi:MAG: TM0996/MTH895 family glutaredoxin-like protein [Bacteriovoracaceae bacterium]|nr:TM0996/MTH895 family glutaredoxin-like protein [Bacteriovoracaceae bacterium]
MKIQILGTGCKKCKDLFSNTVVALEKIKLDADLVKVEDVAEIVSMGVLMTPGIAVDGKVLGSGRVFEVDEVVKMLGSL